MTSQTKPRRSDGLRNRERLVEAAAAVVARDGAEASLEEIARRAGVGSATLHRHFRSRYELLNAVFRDAVENLRTRAHDLAREDPAGGLATWLGELATYSAGTRGLAIALQAQAVADGVEPECCHDIVKDATTLLASRAVEAGTLRPEVSPDDLVTLVNGIAIAAEGDPDQAGRLLALATQGFQPTYRRSPA